MKIKNTALIVLYVVLFFGGTYHAINFITPTQAPLREFQDRYDLKIGASLHAPFFFKYYLFSPQNYDPAKKYPLVLMLHGASRHMKSTGTLTSDALQEAQAAFVVVPVAPPQFTWGGPVGPFMSALPLAISAVKSVTRAYNIDENRIYVTGYSMGGIGTFNALTRYPDLFAAAVPLCGLWDTNDITELSKVPTWIFHGTQDTSISVEYSREIYAAAQQQNMRNIRYTELTRYGHNVWEKVYNTPELWLWLYSQKKK